jgi:3',5'-cyclic AMP phosphodiesterase CpdA
MGNSLTMSYKEYVNLFRSIFRLPQDTTMHFVPGNHDLPLGPNRLFSPYARDRYINDVTLNLDMLLISPNPIKSWTSLTTHWYS